MPVTDDAAMLLALEEARAALVHGDVPVGALVVVNGEVVASRHNERELTGDPTAHAELLAVREAALARRSWRLDDATVYVTLEPCTMCAGMLVNARVGRLVFGAYDPKAGGVRSLYSIADDPRLNHRMPIAGGVREQDCGDLLRAFFRERRTPLS